MSEVSSADVCFLSVVLFEKRLERWISAEKCCWLNHLFAELNVLALWLVSRTERSGGVAERRLPSLWSHVWAAGLKLGWRVDLSNDLPVLRLWNHWERQTSHQQLQGCGIRREPHRLSHEGPEEHRWVAAMSRTNLYLTRTHTLQMRRRTAEHVFIKKQCSFTSSGLIEL